MNLVDIKKQIHTNTVNWLKEKTYPTKEGKLCVLTPLFKNMGHNVEKVHNKYPSTNLENKSHNGFANLEIQFSNNLIDVIEQHITVDKPQKMAVLTEIDPIYIGGKNTHIANTSEAVLFRHTTLSAAQYRSHYRNNYYDKNNKAKFKTKFWNELQGSNQISYIYNVNLMCRAEQHIVESDLPQTAANESRLVKELYNAYPNSFNVITFDTPNVPRNFEYHQLSSAAKETLKKALYQKLYKSFELMQKKHIKVAVIPEIGFANRIPVSVIAETLRMVMKEFVFFKGYKQSLTKIIFVNNDKLEKEFKKEPLI